MLAEYGTIESQVLSENLTLFGMSKGPIIVPAGIQLILHGTITGGLRVEEGGFAEVNGTVHGGITNRSENLIMRGVVYGLLASTVPVQIMPDAIIDGRRH